MADNPATKDLIGTLQKIRDIPSNIVSAGRRLLGEPDTSSSSSPSAGDNEAANKYMEAASKHYQNPTPAPVKAKPAPAPKKPTASGPKPLPVYHTGTDNVPKTGPAVLEKGEAVLEKHEAAEYRKQKNMSKDRAMSAATHALGGKESKPKKEIESMRIKRAANGGHIITHHHTHPEHHPSEDHVTKGDDELAQHVMTHMGDPNDGEAEADAGNAGIPAQVGASAGSAMPAPQAGTSAAAPGM